MLDNLFNQIEGFDWDKANIQKNKTKHNVSPMECEQVFFNEPLIINEALKHLGQEARFYALGQTDLQRTLFVCFTIRGQLIRIISARDMSRKERHVYHENKKTDSEV